MSESLLSRKGTAPVRVVIVDDSNIMRVLLCDAVEASPLIKVIGMAADPYEARIVIREMNPDVVILDVEMPKMNGLQFLEKIMELRPLPVIMVSGGSLRGTDVTFRALDLGAVDFVAKPVGRNGWNSFSETICRKVFIAAQANVTRPQDGIPRISAEPSEAQRGNNIVWSARGNEITPPPETNNKRQISHRDLRFKLISVGSSTGGVTAIAHLLRRLPRLAPPMVIAQHMPAGFTKRFAERLGEKYQRDIAEAQDGEHLQSGMIRVAPGDQHLRISNEKGRLTCCLDQSKPISGHRPSVDALFESTASELGQKAIGIILTGMGSDGALGLQQMRKAGAMTYAQSQDTCVVYGMPRSAVRLNAVEKVLDIQELAKTLAEQSLLPRNAKRR